jgi:DNA-binding LytR/AlgR family response regulator
MRVLIIEDEQVAATRLMHLLRDYDPALEVAAHLYSVEESLQWLQQEPPPDVIFSDIHLSDGFCFDIFKQINCQRPVIFTTAYDQYAIEAFRVFSIDYLLKPVTQEALSAAMEKLKTLQAAPFQQTMLELTRLMQQQLEPRYKDRFLAKSGQKMFFVSCDDVDYFQADDKIVYLVDKQGNKFVVDHTLDRLEALLNPRDFFRLNRRYLVRFSSISQIRPHINSRLKLLIRNGNKHEEVILSRERVQPFRQWANA